MVWALAVLVTGFAVLLAITTWMLVDSHRLARSLQRDNYRLIRRLGEYHSVSLGTSKLVPDLPTPAQAGPPPVPFRMRRPTPPLGWKPQPFDPEFHKPTPLQMGIDD